MNSTRIKYPTDLDGYQTIVLAIMSALLGNPGGTLDIRNTVSKSCDIADQVALEILRRQARKNSPSLNTPFLSSLPIDTVGYFAVLAKDGQLNIPSETDGGLYAERAPNRARQMALRRLRGAKLLAWWGSHAPGASTVEVAAQALKALDAAEAAAAASAIQCKDLSEALPAAIELLEEHAL